MPKVSVIVPTFNSAEYIQETIESILAQNFQDFEIIIVDDASTDNTAEVVNFINSNKITYIRLSDNHGGPSKPRNIGIQYARGEYVAFFDSDDIMLPGRLELGSKFLDEYQNIGMTFTDAHKFDNSSGVQQERFLLCYDKFRETEKTFASEGRFIIDVPHAFNCLFYENYILTCGVTVRRSVFDKIGYFDDSLINGDDRDMWFRISKIYPVGFIDYQSFRYRLRQGSISKRGALLAENRIKVLRKQLSSDLQRSIRRQAFKLISQNLYGIGYYYRQQGDYRKARMYFMNSLKEYINWASLKGILTTYLGNTILRKFTI